MVDEREERVSPSFPGLIQGRFERGRPWWADRLDSAAAQELGQELVHHAAELVALAPELGQAERDGLFEAVLDSLVALRNGSTRIPLPEMVANLATDARARWVVSTSAGDTDAATPLVVVGDWLYHQRTLHYERSLARAVRARHAMPEATWDTSTFADAIAALDGAPGVRLSDEQRAAVVTAARLPLSVVTGGPGTGKTSIVVALLRLLVRLGVEPTRIALAAPTGKAANRLGESLAAQLSSEADDDPIREVPAPGTLHRLLRYAGDGAGFRRDETDPIPADWVIVDEASMIDLVLMERLVRCVPQNAHLVLLGDVEQLPSVDTGTVLRDLIGSPLRGTEAAHVARLRSSFRMDPADPDGRSILSLADAVRSGDVEGTAERLTTSPGGVSYLDVSAEDYRGELVSFAQVWFEERITALDDFWELVERRYPLHDGRFDDADTERIASLFSHFARFRILCLTRVFAAGTNALNEAFHARLARRTIVESAPEFIPGEPVLMLRNDYERGLFNGDQGLVLWVDTGDDVRATAVFPADGEYRAHHLSGLYGQLSHAWAMTVHKSQGSEFDEVAVLLPEEDVPILSRELLYTAITRARRRVQLLGPRDLLAEGISRTVQRYSGLREEIERP